jgi:outer membrane immunogenic protein
MMKKLLLAGIAFATVAGPALAADLARPPPPAYVAPVVYAPVYSWAGFYVGGNAGWASGNFDPTTSTVFNGTYFLAIDVPAVNAAGAQSIKPNDFTGGLQIGYNWQVDKLVFGLEGDIESFRLSGNAAALTVYPGAGPGASCALGNCFSVNSSTSTTWLATARGRIGLAADNWLFYATGGAAFTTLKGNLSFSDQTGVTETPVSFSNSKTGYTAGGGVEAGLSPSWTVKAEYLYVKFGTVSATGSLLPPAAAGQPMLHSMDLKANIVRLGINYKFGAWGY